MLFFLMFSMFFLIPCIVVRCVQDGCSSDSVEKLILSLINLFMIFLILYFIGNDDIFYLSIFPIMISMLCDISDICDDDYSYDYDGGDGGGDDGGGGW